MGKLILVRHGQSTYNDQNKFTGCTDVPLTELGFLQAERAAETLKHIPIHATFCSALMRAWDTQQTILRSLGLQAELLPSYRSAALNERDYGALTGMNKQDAAVTYGKTQVQTWRRSYHERPPQGESLANTRERVIQYYNSDIKQRCADGEHVMIVAHGNSLRALVGHLLDYSAHDFQHIEIAWCCPWVLDFTGSVLRHMRVVKNPLVSGRNGIATPETSPKMRPLAVSFA